MVAVLAYLLVGGLAIVLMAASLGNIVMSLWHLWVTTSPWLWPVTRGRIERCSIVEVATAKGKRFLPSVEYTYEVRGQRYSSNRYWSISTTYDRRERAEKAIMHLVPGASITLFIDRRDPRQAVVNPRPSMLIVFAVPLGLAGLAFAYPLASFLVTSSPTTVGGSHSNDLIGSTLTLLVILFANIACLSGLVTMTRLRQVEVLED